MQTLWTTAFFLILSFVTCLRALPFSMQSLHINPIMDFINPTTTAEPATQKFGTLKLCPPGGRSFFEAFQLACPMRKKRSVPPEYEYDDFVLPNMKPKDSKYRPATIDEIMKICCVKGCEFTDFFPHCGPFGAWKTKTMESPEWNSDGAVVAPAPHNPYPNAVKYTREEMMLIKETQASLGRPDYLSREFDDESGRFVPDKWFDQMFAVEVSKNALAGRKKNLTRIDDELGLSPQRRQFTGGCVPGSNKNQNAGKWRNGKTANSSDGQRQDNKWRPRPDDNGDRIERYNKNRHHEETLPEWADSNISINDIVELKGFDGAPPVTSKLSSKETPRGYSEADLLEELKRKGPPAQAEKESAGSSRFIHLFKRNTESQKPVAPQSSKDPLHGLSNLFSQPQENLPSMPYSGVMASEFESRMNIADDDKPLLPELTNAIRSPPTVHTKDTPFTNPVRSENNAWTEEALFAELLRKSEPEKRNRSPPRDNKEAWNRVSNAPISSELYGLPRNEPLDPERGHLASSPSMVRPTAQSNLQPAQLPNERQEAATPPLLPPPFDQVIRNYPPNELNRGSQRSDSPSSTSSRRSVPPPFNNFPPFPNGPIPPSMFIPGLNGMPMLNPFAFPGMNFPPGMMPPPMGGAPPPPPNANRSGVNLPTSVLLRRRNNEANASPDVDQQQRPPMRTEMTNFDSNLHDDNIRQNSPLPDDPSEVRSGSRNANFGNPQNERPPNMMPNIFPFDLMMCNMFSMAPGGGPPMPPMGVPDGRGFPPMFRMPPPGMSLPPGVFPMQGPMCPPSTSNMNNPGNEDRPWNRSPVPEPGARPPPLADPAPTEQPFNRIPDSIMKSIPTTAKMMTVEDLERTLLSKN